MATITVTPGNSISAAISSAVANNANPTLADRVLLAAGTHQLTTSLNLNKSIIFELAAGAILQAPTDQAGQNVILRVTGSTTYAIVQGSGTIQGALNPGQGLPGTGIRVETGARIWCRSNNGVGAPLTVKDCNYGIRLDGAKPSVLDGIFLRDVSKAIPHERTGGHETMNCQMWCNRMSVNDAAVGSDTGAQGLIVYQVPNSEPMSRWHHNTVWTARAPSIDYVSDGAACEAYGGGNTIIEDNIFYDSMWLIESGQGTGSPNGCDNIIIRRNLMVGRPGVGDLSGADFSRDFISGILHRSGNDWKIYDNEFDRLDSAAYIFNLSSGYSGVVNRPEMYDNLIRLRNGTQKAYSFDKAITGLNFNFHDNYVVVPAGNTRVATNNGTHYTRTQLAAWQTATGQSAGDIWSLNEPPVDPDPDPTDIDVAVDRSVTIATNQMETAAYWLQHTLAFTGNAGWSAGMDMTAELCEWQVVHMGGGYSNSNQAAQSWTQVDPAPSAGVRQWATVGSRDGLDQYEQRWQSIDTRKPGTKYALVMHDYFQQTQDPARTRTASSGNNFFPPFNATQRGVFATIVGEILGRYPGRYDAICIGQEFKGWDRFNVGGTYGLAAFVDHVIQLATYIRANFPTIEIWLPHTNVLALSGEPTRTNLVDGLIANTGGLYSNDLDVFTYVIQNVPSSLYDRLSYDISVVDFNGGTTQRDINYIMPRTMLDKGIIRELHELEVSLGKTPKPKVCMEQYINVNLPDTVRYTDKQLSAGLGSMLCHSAVGPGSGIPGLSVQVKWQPEGDTGSATLPYNRGSFFSKTGVTTKFSPDTVPVAGGTPYPFYYFMKDFKSMFPPGTPFKKVTSSDPLVEGFANTTDILLINKSAVDHVIALTDTVTAATVQVAVPAYSHLKADIPPVGGPVQFEILHEADGAINGGTGPTTASWGPDTATAGNLLVAFALVSNNGGAARWTTPAEWTPGGEVTSLGHVHLKMFTKIAEGDETGITLQHTVVTNVFGTIKVVEVSGAKSATLTPVAANTNSNVLNVNMLDSGSIAIGPDGCMVFAALGSKNSDAQTEGGQNYLPLDIDNHNMDAGGVQISSNQRVTLGVYVKTLVGHGTENEKPTLANSAVRPYAGMIVAFEPARTEFVKSGSGVSGNSTSNKGSGAKVRQATRTGAGVSARIASGAKIRDRVPKQNSGIISSTTGSGVKVYVPFVQPPITYTKTGAGVSPRTASGASVWLIGQAPGTTYTKQNIAVTPATASGAKVYQPAPKLKTGLAEMPATASGLKVYETGVPPSVINIETGEAVLVAVGSGASEVLTGQTPGTLYTKTGAGVTARTASGSSTLDHATIFYIMEGVGKTVGTASGASELFVGQTPTTFYEKINGRAPVNANGEGTIFTQETFSTGGVHEYNKTGRVLVGAAASGRKVST